MPDATNRCCDLAQGRGKDTPDLSLRISGVSKSERSSRTFCGSKSTTPERSWRASVAKVATPRSSRRGSKVSTPERSWRSSCFGRKVVTPETTWRASTLVATPRPKRAVGNPTLLDRGIGGNSVGDLHRNVRGQVQPNETAEEIQSLLAKGVLSTAPGADADDLQNVKSRFMAQVPDVSVLGVYRVENTNLGLVHAAVRGTMEIHEERDLWHGTSSDCVRNITLNGFNRAYCGRHGMRLGHGTYFSASADYSVRFCSRKSSSRVMFLAKVLVGKWTKGSPEMKEPPHLDSEGMARFDSVVNDVEFPSIFCIFKDFQAMPLFLVEFSGVR